MGTDLRASVQGCKLESVIEEVSGLSLQVKDSILYDFIERKIFFIFFGKRSLD
jgi:hypothetical protein